MGQVNGVTTRVDLNKFNGSWNDLMAFASSAPPKPQVGISQVSGNDGVTLVNWPDKHVELFAVSGAGDLVHSFTSGANDTWSAPAVLDGKARCGMAAGFWGDPWNYAEVWGPLTGGGAGHLWFAGGKWNKWQDLGGMGLGLSHFSTLGMADGRVDVFALGNDGAIHRNYWDLAKKDWSGWKSTGGKLATGAAGITWLDGHGELFAADGQGAAWHAVFTNDKWGAWAVLGMGVASRPVPVRWEDGHVEVFARGVDAQLKHAWWDGKMWQGFATLSGGTMIVGEPSAIMNPKGGGGAAGPEVFARDAQGRVLHAWWNGTGWTDFEPLGMQAARSDPFGWIRGDGRAAVFAVDAAGGLVHASRAANGAWSAWSKIGDGIATCADAPSAPVDGGVDQAGPTGRDDFGGPADLARAGDGGGETMKGGCGCRVGGAPSTGGWLFAFALLALLAHRRR
jgi:MYXO-CTERM domain-containing protein